MPAAVQLRRSFRTRKQTPSLYDDAYRYAAAEEVQARTASAGATGSVRRETQTQKQKLSDEESDTDNDAIAMEEDLMSQGESGETEDAEEADEDEDTDSSSESDSDSDTDSDSDAEEAPPARKPSPRRKSISNKSKTAAISSSPSFHAPKPKVPPRSSLQSKPKAKPKANAKTAAASTGTDSGTAVAAPTRHQFIAALKTLTNKVFLLSDDTDANTDNKATTATTLTLAAALLRSCSDQKPTGEKKRTVHGSGPGGESFWIPPVQDVVRQLLEDHQDNTNNNSAADIRLINLVLQSVGGKQSLLEEDTDLEEMSPEDWATQIDQIVGDMETTPVDRVLIVADRAAPSTGTLEYLQLYADFWYQLAAIALNSSFAATKKSSDEDRLFQVEWVRDRLSRLVELVVVGVPDIRFAGSIAIYQMGHAMLEHTNELRAKLDTSTRLHTAATRNNQNRKAEALKVQIDSWTRSVADLEHIVKETIMSVFSIRFKDSNPHVRKVSLDALNWYCRARPDVFVASYYLKYFGWMLSDKVAIVRIAAIRGLMSPIQSDIDPGRMTGVIAKFLERLAECICDVDNQVQEIAMNFLLLLMRGGYFDTVENNQMWLRINARALSANTTPSVRRDALYFIMEQLDAFDNGLGKSEREAAAQITAIGKWIAHSLSDNSIPSELIRYEKVDLVVQSLREMPDYKPLLSNWAAMLRSLQGEDRRKSISKGDQRQSIVTQRVLVRFLLTSVQTEVMVAATEYHESILDPDMVNAWLAKQGGLQIVRTGGAKSRKNAISSTHEDLTMALLSALPGLLATFRSETQVMQCLTSLPQYFHPNVLNMASRKKEFQSLMTNLSSVFMDSADPAILKNVCLSISCLVVDDHSRSNDALLVLKKFAVDLRARLIDLLRTKSEFAKGNDERHHNQSTATDAELESSISLCLRRLCILSKRWSITRLLGKGDSGDADLDEICAIVSNYLEEALKERQSIDHSPEAQFDSNRMETAKIWSTVDSNVHAVMAESVSEGLNLILAMTAWRLNAEIELIDQGKVDYDAADIQNHAVIRLRDRLLNLIVNCHEHFIEPCILHNLTEVQKQFALAVQQHALRVSGDLRSLFPRKWRDSISPFLVACSLADDSILTGPTVRFVRSQTKRIKYFEDGPDEKRQLINMLLYPVCRALGTNWKGGNRREAGCILAHISGSGKDAHELVLAMTRVFKKLGPVRLLEAHMACLRQDFQDWMESMPEELSDRPTDAEMQECEKQEKVNQTKFDAIVNQAGRLSASLGVGKIRDAVLSNGLFGFVREGVRYAFSTDIDRSDELLPVGSRLPFLTILSKYVVWIRKNDEFKNAVLAELNAYEIELRADPDFDEVFDEDLGALVDFRKSGMFGEFVVADVDSNAVIRTAVTHTRSDKNSMKPRTSMGSSVSSIRSKISTQSTLDSIREGKGGGAPDTTARKHQQRELSQASSGKSPAVQEEASSSTPSPPKRRRMISSAHSGASISTLGLSRDEEGGNDSNDDDDDTRSSIPSRTKRRRTVSSPASKSTIDGDLKSDLDDTGDEDDKEETSYN